MDAHKLTTQAPPAPAPTERPTTSKPANLEWPRLEMDMTDPEWSLFMAEWARYCKSCKLTDEQEKVDQLQGCLSGNLKRAAAGDGLENVSEESSFLPRLKLLDDLPHAGEGPG